MAHACNRSSWEVEAGRPGIQGHPRFHRQFQTHLVFKKKDRDHSNHVDSLDSSRSLHLRGKKNLRQDFLCLVLPSCLTEFHQLQHCILMCTVRCQVLTSPSPPAHADSSKQQKHTTFLEESMTHGSEFIFQLFSVNLDFGNFFPK